MEAPKGYESLCEVLGDAVVQASMGKGRERHAEAGEPFDRQIICEVARRVGLGYPLGQACKQIYESQRIGGEKGRAELLGAINYIAAAVIVDREMDEHDNALFDAECARAKAENRQKFKVGDKVQANWHGDGVWVDGTVFESVEMNGTTYLRVALETGHTDCIPVDRIRKAPRAEGCEELVQDAPKTKNDLIRRIVEVNPTVYPGVDPERLLPRKPTGEELAEIAEGEAHD